MVRNPVVDNNGAKMGGYEATGGVADAGAYLSVVVQGLVQAKVSGATALQTGDWITLEGGDVTLAAPDEVIGRQGHERDRCRWTCMGHVQRPVGGDHAQT